MKNLRRSKANGRLAVDNNAVIAYREGISEVCSLVEEADIIFLPVTVLGELLYGAYNSVRHQENKRAVRRFMAQSILINIDENIVARYANVRLKLKKIGRPIPENDIWIAAACLEIDAVLLTQDIHFKYIADLNLTEWTVS